MTVDCDPRQEDHAECRARTPGEEGGRIVAAGTPVEISTNSESKTAAFLAAFMSPEAAA